MYKISLTAFPLTETYKYFLASKPVMVRELSEKELKEIEENVRVLNEEGVDL